MQEIINGRFSISNGSFNDCLIGKNTASKFQLCMMYDAVTYMSYLFWNDSHAWFLFLVSAVSTYISVLI